MVGYRNLFIKVYLQNSADVFKEEVSLELQYIYNRL